MEAVVQRMVCEVISTSDLGPFIQRLLLGPTNYPHTRQHHTLHIPTDLMALQGQVTPDPLRWGVLLQQFPWVTADVPPVSEAPAVSFTLRFKVFLPAKEPPGPCAGGWMFRYLFHKRRGDTTQGGLHAESVVWVQLEDLARLAGFCATQGVEGGDTLDQPGGMRHWLKTSTEFLVETDVHWYFQPLLNGAKIGMDG